MTDVRAKNEADLVRFYLDKSADRTSMFHVWEDGGSWGDSVTPSTYSQEYRTWMTDALVAELDRNGGGLLSLGCGNAAVEAEVVRRGYQVSAIDAMAEAVQLAQRKGVHAVQADIYQWAPEQRWSVVYIDGVLGHLYNAESGITDPLSRIRSWLAPCPDSASGAATLVASNDAPKNGSPAEKAPGVDGFYWLSAAFIGDQARAAGFEGVRTCDFRYRRPLSGERVRSVVTGHVTR